jgi:hypothetical protein
VTAGPHHQHTQALQARYVARRRQRRLSVGIGLFLLFSGYALLAISPDTPLDWVLIRVAAGFGLLFSGFALAILPWLARISGADD